MLDFRPYALIVGLTAQKTTILMRKLHNLIQLSATDLVGHLNCGHLIQEIFSSILREIRSSESMGSNIYSDIIIGTKLANQSMLPTGRLTARVRKKHSRSL